MFNKKKICLKKSVKNYDYDYDILYDDEIVLRVINIIPRESRPKTYLEGSLWDLWDKGYRFEIREDYDNRLAAKGIPLNSVLGELGNYSYRSDKNNKYYNYTYCKTPYEIKHKSSFLIKYAMENGMLCLKKKSKTLQKN